MKVKTETSQAIWSQVTLISVLLGLVCLLTYYFRSVLGSGTVFTHFFYIPIILACIWWKRRGLVITFFLVALFLASPWFMDGYRLTWDDYLRTAMLLLISLVMVVLAERLSAVRGELQSSEARYRIVFETTGTAMLIIEDDTLISLVNAEFEKLSGFSRTDVENRKSFTEFVSTSDKEKMLQYHRMRRTVGSKAPKHYEIRFINKAGQVREVFTTIDLIPGTGKSVASFSDITELKLALNSQTVLQESLSNALTKVLSGFIPICANCKRTRDENNNWVQIETYIQDRTEASFSHGICPDCARKLYPDLAAVVERSSRHS